MAESVRLDRIYTSIDKEKEDGGKERFRTHHDGGDGLITQIALLPGIWLFYQEFHSETIAVQRENLPFSPDILSIQHCQEGRFECEYRNGEFVYLGEGDLAINIPETSPVHSSFPLSHYKGINIVIAEEEAKSQLVKLSEIMGGLDIDLGVIRKRIERGNRLEIFRADEQVKHILSELYQPGEELPDSYLRIKCLELLMFLSRADGISRSEHPYFDRRQVAAVKGIYKLLTENPERHFTLEELSEAFDIPLSSLKKCFRGVYGAPVAAYMRQFRLQKAAELLRSTSKTTAEIGAEVGYETPSKFAAAFRKQYQVTPSEFRKTK